MSATDEAERAQARNVVRYQRQQLVAVVLLLLSLGSCVASGGDSGALKTSGFLLLAGAIGFHIAARRGARRAGALDTVICQNCGNSGIPVRFTKGSLLIEIVLWICFIVPGLIYSLWRLTTRQDVCRACSSAQLVPLDSPVGKRLRADFGAASSSARPSKGQGHGAVFAATAFESDGVEVE